MAQVQKDYGGPHNNSSRDGRASGRGEGSLEGAVLMNCVGACEDWLRPGHTYEVYEFCLIVISIGTL